MLWRSPPSKEKVTSKPSISLVFQEAIWEANPVKDIGSSFLMDGKNEPLESPLPSPSRPYSDGTYLAGAGAKTTKRITKNTPMPQVQRSFFLCLFQKLCSGAAGEFMFGCSSLPNTGFP